MPALREGGSFSPLARASASRLIAAPWVGGTASRLGMINRMRKGSQGSGATSKPAKPVSTAFYEELFNKFKDSEERRPPASCAPQHMLADP